LTVKLSCTEQSYAGRNSLFVHRRNNRELINKARCLADSDFIIRTIYKDTY